MQQSYLKQEYARKVGKIEVSKFIKISENGDIGYVERRYHTDSGKSYYKTGTIIGRTINLTNVSASEADEYNANLKAALEGCGINI